MERLSIIYSHYVDDYYDNESNSHYIFQKIEGIDIEDPNIESTTYILNKISQIKKIIINTFKVLVLEDKIKDKKNNEELVKEIQALIRTYDNGVDYTLDDYTNFIIFTEDYIYFNNMENFIDDSLFGCLTKEAILYQTTIIMNTKLSEFYFITTSTNMTNAKSKTIIKKFIVDNDEFKTTITKHNTNFINYDYSEAGLKKILRKLNNK